MRRLVTIEVPPASTALTTVAAVRSELGQVTAAQALRLPGLIDQASSLVTGYLGRELARATVKEAFVWSRDMDCPGAIVLSRTPIATLTSVSFDGVDQDLTELDFDENAGLLYRHSRYYNLDYNVSGYGYGYRTEVTYEGGYLLPGDTGRTLPAAIERACIDVVLALWYRAGRGDPMIRSETIDGIGSTQYLDPVAGAGAVMPPAAAAALSPFCNYAV